MATRRLEERLILEAVLDTLAVAVGGLKRGAATENLRMAVAIIVYGCLNVREYMFGR